MNIQELVFNSLNEALPEDVMNLINDTAVIENVFPVNHGEIFNGQILKADEIICQPDATLTLSNANLPFWVIYCNKLKLKNNSFPIKIEIDPTINGKNGGNGVRGIDGANGIGEVDREGQPGSAGQVGLAGEDGEFLKNPDLYIIAKEIICIDTLQNIEDSKFVLDFDGIGGGDGGNGGNGGNGSNGKEGATSAFDCKTGPGRGGNGAGSGKGGQGGQGGNGSNASDIYFVSTAVFTEVFVNASKFYIRGGNGGVGGNGGKAGKPGYGGNGGPGNGWCGRGSDGSDGIYPEPRTLGDGQDGEDGNKGNVFKVTLSHF